MELEEICGNHAPVSSQVSFLTRSLAEFLSSRAQVWAVTDDGNLVRDNWKEEELACVQQQQGSDIPLAWTCPPNTYRQGSAHHNQSSTFHQKDEIGYRGNSSMDLGCEVDAQRNASHHQLLIVDSICISVRSLPTFFIRLLLWVMIPLTDTYPGQPWRPYHHLPSIFNPANVPHPPRPRRLHEPDQHDPLQDLPPSHLPCDQLSLECRLHHPGFLHLLL